MRRRLKSNTEYTLRTARGDIARNRRFERPSEMRKAKRVRFEDTEMDGSPVHASSKGGEAIQSQRCGSPKTSEYAYFRKVKNGVHGHSHALHKGNEQFKSSKFNYLIRETTSARDMFKPSREDLNFPVSGEGAGPSNHNLFLSPRVSKYGEPVQIRSKEMTNKIEKGSPLLSESATPVGQSLFSSPLNVASEKSVINLPCPENQCYEKGLFSAKRHRLLQWVAHTSFSEDEKLHAKGFALVSLLLCRLLPKANENNDSSKGDGDNNSKSLKFHESNNLEEGLYLSHKRGLDKDLRNISPGGSNEIVLAGWDRYFTGFRPSYSNESHLQNESMDPDQHSKYRSSHTQTFESYRSSGSFHFKDLDEFGSVLEHRREPHRLSLEWETELGKDRVDSSIVNHDVEKNVCVRLANSWNVDQRRIVDDVLNAEGLCPSSLFPNCLEFNALPNFSSTSCLMHGFGPNFNAVKCAMEEPGQFSLAAPYTPQRITLAVDRNGGNICSNGDIFSHRDQHWLKKKVWDGKPQSKFWWKYLSAADFSAEGHPVYRALQFPENERSLYSLSRLKQAPGEPFTPLCEDAFNRYLSSPILQSSLHTIINRPLSLNHVSQDGPNQELCFDDYDTELRYRKIL